MVEDMDIFVSHDEREPILVSCYSMKIETSYFTISLKILLQCVMFFNSMFSHKYPLNITVLF